MHKFTVLLLYPDYMAETYGHETYLTSVEADNVEHAIGKARAEVAPVNDDPKDFHVLAVFAGEHDDIKP